MIAELQLEIERWSYGDIKPVAILVSYNVLRKLMFELPYG